MQKTGLSASIFWLCQKDLRCNPWRGPGTSGDFARKKMLRKNLLDKPAKGNTYYLINTINPFQRKKELV
jgi:hypothetical protein